MRDKSHRRRRAITFRRRRSSTEIRTLVLCWGISRRPKGVSDHKRSREQGAQLHAELQKLIPTISMINEQVIRLKHDGIHHEAEALMEGRTHGKKLGPGSLVELQTILWMVDGF